MLFSRMRLELYWRLWGNFRTNIGYFFHLFHRNEAARIRRIITRGLLPETGSYFPTRLNLRLLYQCNLRCKMCGQWGESGTYHAYDGPRRAEALGQDVIVEVLKELCPKGLKLVDMEGGETLLYPQFGEFLYKLQELNVYVKFATNGTLLEKHSEAIVRSRVRSVTVSLDGDRETHNSVRGAGWAYDKTIRGLQALSRMKKQLGRHTPLVQIAFTMSRHNGADALKKLCDDLRGKKLADVLEVKFTPIFVPPRAERQYSELVNRWFGVSEGITSPGGFRDDYSDFGEESAKIIRVAEELKGAPLDFFLELLPHIPLDEVPRLYSDYSWDLGRSPCTVPFTEPTIDADGNVYPCNLFTDAALSMGNVNDTPFLDIWQGERFTTFRKMLIDEGGLLPICNRCCQLTEY